MKRWWEELCHCPWQRQQQVSSPLFWAWWPCLVLWGVPKESVSLTSRVPYSLGDQHSEISPASHYLPGASLLRNAHTEGTITRVVHVTHCLGKSIEVFKSPAGLLRVSEFYTNGNNTSSKQYQNAYTLKWTLSRCDLSKVSKQNI